MKPLERRLIEPSRPLERTFFARPTLKVAVALLGTLLVRREAKGDLTTGIIYEVEAYIGSDDLACHARSGQTARNAAMWGPPGNAYVYFTYGMHWMLNAVTEPKGNPAAVLLRAAFPQNGIERMRARRGHKADHLLSDGPAKLCQAFAIDRTFDQRSLCDGNAALTIHPGMAINPDAVQATPRVGIKNVPEPWRSIPWRFFLHPKDLSGSSHSH